jgi:plasmid stabilization system protein ParE
MSENRIYTVIVSDRAKYMLGEHVHFMAKVNKDAAVEKKKQIMAALRSLRQMPHSFPNLGEDGVTSNKYRKMFIEKWYIVLYQIQDETVYVDYILDVRRGYDWFI